MEFTLAIMEVCPVNRAVLEIALTFAMPDFEDAVQVACAINQGLDAIVTRDHNFVSTSISVLSVTQIFQQLKFTD